MNNQDVIITIRGKEIGWSNVEVSILGRKIDVIPHIYKPSVYEGRIKLSNQEVLLLRKASKKLGLKKIRLPRWLKKKEGKRKVVGC